MSWQCNLLQLVRITDISITQMSLETVKQYVELLTVVLTQAILETLEEIHEED